MFELYSGIKRSLEEERTLIKTFATLEEALNFFKESTWTVTQIFYESKMHFLHAETFFNGEHYRIFESEKIDGNLERY